MVEFMRKLPSIRTIFVGCKFSEYFLDELLDVIKCGNLQVKSNASHAFCLLLRQEDIYKKRDQYLTDIRKLKDSESYYERVSFLIFSEALTFHFSQQFLKTQKIITAIADLSNDKISNMRIRVVNTIMNIALYLKEDLLKVLINTITTLCNDTNKDVREKAKKAAKVFANLNDMANREERNKTDSEREEEEKCLLGIVR